jgi:1,4-alpha-glucan branching enzyme
MHTAGLGVILDWVPAHFPKDEWGLYEFDGSPLYEYQGRDRQESRSWGTRFFDVGREEVQSFLVSSALYWLREFHADGLRVDAVASMLYLDFDKLPGEWNPNPDGSNYCKEAIAFFRKLNGFVLEEIPDALMIAEESTDWPGVTRPVSGSETALGFSLKWNMGFANDLYRYLGTDPVFRRYHHTALNFPILYAFRENYILPVSHDEVVHGKLTLLDKCHGTGEDKFLQMRAALLLLMTYPGKKMLFMGTEYAPYREWDHESELEWFMTDYPLHAAMREYVAALNRFYLEESPLWELDFEEEGFSWILADEAERNLVAYRRRDIAGEELLVAISFSGGPNPGVSLPVEDGEWDVVFTTGAEAPVLRREVQKEGAVLLLDLPRFGGAVLKKRRDTLTVG